VEQLADELLPRGEAAVHNQALMELGALVCTPRAPACGDCPLAGACRAHARGDPERYPLQSPRGRIPHRHFEVALVLDDTGALLVDRRPYRGFLGGLWELPKAEREPDRRKGTAIRRAMRERYGIVARKRRGGELAPVEHAYSHFRVTLHPAVYDLRRPAPRAAEAVSWRWIDPERLPGEVALAGADRKVLARFGAGSWRR
jgi:A/G-specific adenine glycosylase